MRRGWNVLFVLVSLAAASGLAELASGCGQEGLSDCSCVDPPAVTIFAPAGLISGVKVTGPACADALPACFNNSADVYPPGCEQTLLFPRHTGECDVEIDLAQDAGVVHESVVLVDTPGACSCGSPQPLDASAGIFVLGDASIDDGG